MRFKTFIKEDHIKTLSDLEREMEKLAGNIDVDITKHFVDRIRERRISPYDIVATFKKFIEKYSSKLGNNKKRRIGGVIKDIMNQLNIPIEYDNKGTPSPRDDSISLITVMKKAGFVPNNKKDQVFQVK